MSLRDWRRDIARGKLAEVATTTSCLSFRRPLLDQLMPLPEAPGISLQDHAFKWGALALGQVFFLNEPLAIQRMHGRNASLTQTTSQAIKTLLQNALYFKATLPAVEQLPDRLFV